MSCKEYSKEKVTGCQSSDQALNDFLRKRKKEQKKDRRFRQNSYLENAGL